MATIDMKRNNSLGVEEARVRAEKLAVTMQDKLGIRWKWEGDKIGFDAPGGVAKGVKGHVSVSPSDVRIEIDLPFLLRPIKGLLEGKVKTYMDDIIGPA